MAPALFASDIPDPGLAPEQPLDPHTGGPDDRAGQQDTAVADAAVVETLLRCWVRETGLRLPTEPGVGVGTGTDAGTGDLVLTMPLPSSAARLGVPVRYWSACGWHRFGTPRLTWLGAAQGGSESAGIGTSGLDVESGSADTDASGAEVNAGLLAALLVREAADNLGGVPAGPTTPAPRPSAPRPSLREWPGTPHREWPGTPHREWPGTPAETDALGRILDSAQRIAVHVHYRRTRSGTRLGTQAGSDDFLQATWAAGAATRGRTFLAAERSLVAGHPFHPAAKSRDGAGPAELAAYSPELDGSFPLHWFAAHPSVVTIRGHAPAGTGDAGVSGVLRSLAGPAAIPAGYVAVPAHPWQAREVRTRPAVAALLADGRLIDVGPAGPHWYPTASLRTVWRPDAPVMLKLSLGMRITNSRRENTRRELELGVQVAQLIEAGLGDWLATHHPNFRLIPDPAWIGVDAGGKEDGCGERNDGSEGNGGMDSGGCGLDTAVRANPIGAGDRVVCVAALVADNLGSPGTRPSPLAGIVTAFARARGCPTGDAAAAWFARYLDVVAVPVLGMYLDRGVGVEAHHQNTLVTLDDDGWPVAGWYRDSQGYYVAASHAAEVAVAVPGFGDGVDAVFDDAFVEERLVYYTIVNNIFGVIGALGAGGVADETRLLGVFRTLLTRLAKARQAAGEPPARLLATLLEAPTLPCKGNLLTCVDGRDEVVEPVAVQSVYVEIPNPLVTAHR